MKKAPHSLPSPAFICAGPLEETIHFTITYLQTLLCPHKTIPCRCSNCVAIAQRQSAAITWIEPEADYVLEDIEPVLHAAQYRLEEGRYHAFVLARAESLSVACANRLLKIVEEPPPGYLFFFLTADTQAVLPTIQSRCILLFQSDAPSLLTQGLITYFTDEEKRNDAVAFDTFLRNESISISQAKQLVHQLVATLDTNHHKNAGAVTTVLEKAQRNFPQPGGANLYLRWLFMALNEAREAE